MHVALHHIVVESIQVLKITSQENASTLTRCLGLDYKSLLLVLSKVVKLLLEILILTGQHPTLRKKVVLIRVLLFHSGLVGCEQVFAP